MADLPYTLIAELTYRCPLRCPYCSNPEDYAQQRDELTTETWQRVFDEARALGVLQLHLTGGEPLARKDLEALVAHARASGLYVNLITSGIPLTEARLGALHDAGLDAVQVSLQGADAAQADGIAGYPGHAHKLAVLGWVKARGLPLTLNVVLHRRNLDQVPALIALAEAVGADRLELANTQYLGWALANRAALLPAREELVEAHRIASEAKQRLKGAMEVLFVVPDYHARHPRACMDGWARRFLHITPDGTALPCHAARGLTGLAFERVTERALSWLWHESPAFNAYRGEAWMSPTCRSCERRGLDFGGCRCQAFALTGEASATDPACSLSPHHDLVVQARSEAAAAAERHYLHRGQRRQ